MVADGLPKPLLSMKCHAFVKQLGMASTTPTSAAPLLPTSITQIEEDDNELGKLQPD